MVHEAPRRTSFSGPTLIRSLARLTDLNAAESRQSLPDRLSQWLGWTHAIALSTVLDSDPPALPGGAPTPAEDEERECARVRTTLAKAIANDGAFSAARRRQQAPRPLPTARGTAQAMAQRAAPESPGPAPLTPAAADSAARTGAQTVDYAVYRQRYLALQRTMETAIGKLRGRLRATLAASHAGMSRLVRVDAVMEQALGERERALLGTIPGLLEAHFHRLRLAEAAAMAEAEAAGTPATLAPGAWLDTFRQDMRNVLLAELDVRLQPVEGLLAALRTRQPGRHG
ncbi:DUF3348 domain-containing protein [Bordetella flabilis]